MKCRKCNSHMDMTRSDNTHKCVQIWYECKSCGSHMLSSTPAELFDITDILRERNQSNQMLQKNRFSAHGSSLN